MNKKVIIVIALIVMMFAATVFAQDSQNLALMPGFNFVSFTADTSIEPQQFADLNSAIEDIYLYSPAASTFLSYKAGELKAPLASGKGYIVKSSANSETTVNVPGTALPAKISVNVENGFNLVGFSKVPSAKITFSQLMKSYPAIQGIYKWSPKANSFFSVVRHDTEPVQIDGTDPAFKAGESYFFNFNIAADTTISYDDTGIVVGASEPEKPVEPEKPAGPKFFKLKTAPVTLPAAPSFQADTPPATIDFDASKHSVKVYDQITGTEYPASGDPTNPAGYVSQIPIDGTPKIIVLEITEKADGHVLARNIVGKCPLIEEIPDEVKALELQNPPIDIKTTTASMLAFEKLGNNVPNYPPFDFKETPPSEDGIIIKSMKQIDTTTFMTELQKAVGGMSVIDKIIAARQGVVTAQNGVSQLRAAADGLRNFKYPPGTPQIYITKNNETAKGLSDGADMIENCMIGIKNALDKIPSSNVPNPTAVSDLLIAYVDLLNEIPKIKAHFESSSSFGMNLPVDMFNAVPEKIMLPTSKGENTIDANTKSADIQKYVEDIPSESAF